MKKALNSGRPLALDAASPSASETLPAFLARPKNAPVYHGFEILHDVKVDGFTFGAITDFESHPSKEGDAFVIAPDGGRAWLVWTVAKRPRFRQICAPTGDRWGVWDVAFPFEMTSRENVKLNLEAILAKLKPEWQRWRQRYARTK